jgi:hypothetical protein
MMTKTMRKDVEKMSKRWCVSETDIIRTGVYLFLQELKSRRGDVVSLQQDVDRIKRAMQYPMESGAAFESEGGCDDNCTS